MHKLFLTITIILITINAHSKTDSIQLPKGGVDNFDLKKKHYTIHITKNNEIYFNSKRMRFWDEIPTSILKEERFPIFNAVEDIILYIDENIDIFKAQRVRDEIGRVWKGYLHYMSDSFKGNKCLSFYINSSFLAKKSTVNYDFFYDEDVIFTSDEKNPLNETKPPKLKDVVELPVLAIWQLSISEVFFTKDVKTINEYLEGITHKKIDASNYSSDNGVFNTSDELKKHIENITTNNDLLFVETHPLTSYKNYFKGMIKIQKKRYKAGGHGDLRKPFIIDVTYSYVEYLKEKGLELFKDPRLDK